MNGLQLKPCLSCFRDQVSRSLQVRIPVMVIMAIVQEEVTTLSQLIELHLRLRLRVQGSESVQDHGLSGRNK